MNVPQDLSYTKDHEWVKLDGDIATVGITDYAQGELGDIVFVELPEKGTAVKKGGAFGTIEAVKAVSDLYAPMSGEVIETNPEIGDHPEVINQDCYGKGWMIRIKIADSAEQGELLDHEKYQAEIS